MAVDPRTLIRPDADLALPDGDDVVVTTDDGARLAVTVAGPAGVPEDAGGALPVVLAHCWTGSRRVWVPVARRLMAAGHRVVLYDQRGHGASTTGDEPLSVDRLGDDLAAVLAAVDLPRVVLAGHSMGGMTVMSFACRHGALLHDRVHGVVLAATAAHGLAAQGRERFWRMVLWRRWIDGPMGRPRLGRLLVRPTFGARPLRAHVEEARAMFVGTDVDVRRGCVEAMGEMDLRAGLGAVDVPTVVLLGTRDTLIVNGLTRAIAVHVAGAEVVELAGAGHLLPFERPDELAAAVDRLAEVDAGVSPSG
ncbi:MAG TPA: alpha/beta fold hydrolase [Acidimicrobiales bacterium]|nr:alpha/beta fold hydrolase [Acidimicrobiales bacterium]